MAEGTQLGRAWVQIVPSAKGISGAISKVLGGEAAAAGKSAGESIVGAIKGVIAAAGIGAAVKSAFSEGAALQQSLGGVETLFKDSAEKVKANAAAAFRSAGLSANAYMETVTGFSASLLQSLGGDTEKAAAVADRAVRDMSDNANKFGTDMQSIQYAYQGFAKDNYTMLDNLKLGYGGTKTEMQRLIADAAKMKDVQAELGVTVDASSLSFGNVVNAISVMQQSLGVTGTTAREAAETFSGSFASMEAAAKNVLGNLTLGEDIRPALSALGDSVFTFVTGNLLPMAGNLLQGLPVVLESAFSMAVRGLNIAAHNADTLVAQGAELVGELAAGVIGAVPYLAESSLSLAAAIGTALIETDWTATGRNVLSRLQDSLTLAAEEILGVDSLPEVPGAILAALQNAAEQFPEKARELLTALGTTIRESDALATLGDSLKEGLSTAVSMASDTLQNLLPPEVWEHFAAAGEAISTAFDTVRDAADRIKEAVAPLITQFLDWASSAETAEGASALLGDALSLASDAVGGIANAVGGLLSAGASFIEWLSNGSTGADLFAAAVAGIAAGFIAYNIATTAMTAAQEGAAAAQALLNAVMSANPVGIVVMAVAGLTAAFITLWHTNEEFRNAVRPIWEWIKSTVKGLCESAVTNFNTAWNTIHNVWSAVSPFFVEVWERISHTFSVVADFLGGVFTLAWRLIQAQWIVVEPFFKGIWNGIQTTFAVVVDVIAGGFSVAWGTIKLVWDFAVGYFENLWNTIQGTFSVVESVLAGDFSGAWEAVKSVFSGWGDFFRQLLNDVIDIFSSVGETWKNIGQDLVNGFLKGIQIAWDGLTGWVGRSISALKMLFTGKSGFDEHSPSHWAEHVFSYIGEGAVLGLKESFPSVERTMGDFTGAVRDSLTPLPDWAARVGRTVTRDLSNGIAVELPESAKKATEAADQIASNLYNGLSKWAARVTKLEALSLSDQTAMWAEIQKQFAAGSDHWWSVEEKLFDLREQAVSEHAKTIQETYNGLVSGVEKVFQRQNSSLFDQLDAYEQIRARFAEGTEEWQKADDKVYSLRTQLQDNFRKAAEDAAHSITALEAGYQDALASRASQIASSYKLFDAVELPEEIKARDLTRNLQDQIRSIRSFYDNLEKLTDRGVDSGLADTIRAMGVSAAGELSALLSMSDRELEHYSALFNEKQTLAEDLARQQLQDLRTTTDAGILDNLDAIRELCSENAPAIGASIPQLLADGIQSGLAAATDAAESAATAVLDTLSRVFSGGLPAMMDPDSILSEDMLRGDPAVRDAVSILSRSPTEDFSRARESQTREAESKLDALLRTANALLSVVRSRDPVLMVDGQRLDETLYGHHARTEARFGSASVILGGVTG